MDAVWVLNLDADLELGARGPYTATRTVKDAMRAQQEKLLAALLASGEDVVDEATAPGAAKGRRGYAFCPTPRAIALLERAGAVVPAHPTTDVLRRVNGRAFCASLGKSLADSEFVTDFPSAQAKLREGTAAWRVKRAFGMAGRGQRVIPPGPLAKSDEDFVRAGLAQGGLVIEPNRRITLEVAIHGMVAPSGNVAFGRIVRQHCDARGAWVSTESVDEPFAFAAEFEAEAKLVARRLHESGYFGPFGVDAFVYDGGFQPRSEINARFSMGFPVGMPDWRDRIAHETPT